MSKEVIKTANGNGPERDRDAERGEEEREARRARRAVDDDNGGRG